MTLTPMIPALNGVFCETTNQPIALVIKSASVYSFTSGLIDSDFNGKFDFFLQIDTDSSYFIQRFETVISEDTDYLAVRKN